MQGPISLNTCIISIDCCKQADGCPMRESWARSQQVLIEDLRATTFEELARAG
jgi:DNA-binding IscR family transcriptional regulator